MGPLYITACASSSSVSREQLSHSSSTTTIVSSCVCVAYVCVCVSVSVFLWHSHTNIPHFLFAFASESLPVSSLSSSALHWKETGRSTLTPTFTVRSQRCSSSTLVSVFSPPRLLLIASGPCLQLHREPGSPCSFIETMMMSVIYKLDPISLRSTVIHHMLWQPVKTLRHVPQSLVNDTLKWPSSPPFKRLNYTTYSKDKQWTQFFVANFSFCKSPCNLSNPFFSVWDSLSL